MNNPIKQSIIKICEEKVQQMIATASQSLQSAKLAAQAETKSSMGDKFETTRAMMQAEVDKAKHQLAVANSLKATLNECKKEPFSEVVKLGSVIITNDYLFYISIGIGKLNIEDKECFVISPASPIGQQLIGKKKHDHILFKRQEVEILEII